MAETYTETDLLAAPLAQHRISGTKAVCDGDADSRCHFWRACDFQGCLEGSDYHPDDHHRHVYSKESCGWLEWVNATSLDDTYARDAEYDEEGEVIWPQGPVEFFWDGDSVIWDYTKADTTKEA